ncbi:hypothetical protein B0H21DRAFT_884722 [Amylocystis lapponica]|nr:hypothetical protein B0H21DRAFT_884722 [Amylocystis lapponica]
MRWGSAGNEILGHWQALWRGSSWVALVEAPALGAAQWRFVPNLVARDLAIRPNTNIAQASPKLTTPGLWMWAPKQTAGSGVLWSGPRVNGALLLFRSLSWRSGMQNLLELGMGQNDIIRVLVLQRIP